MGDRKNPKSKIEANDPKGQGSRSIAVDERERVAGNLRSLLEEEGGQGASGEGVPGERSDRRVGDDPPAESPGDSRVVDLSAVSHPGGGMPGGEKGGRSSKENRALTLGQYLRRVREEKGLSVEELSATTKIKARILLTIEEDRYEGKPPVPILRGFLKCLAAELGVRPEEFLSRFDALDAYEKGERIFPEWSERLDVPKRRPRVWAAALAVLFLVLGVVYLFYADELRMRTDLEPLMPAPTVGRPQASRPGDAATAVPGPGGSGKTASAAAPEPAKAVPQVRPSEGPKKVVPSPGPEAPAPPHDDADSAVVPGTESKTLERDGVEFSVRQSAVSGGGHLTLKITAKEDTWLRVVVDGKRRDEIFLLEGESRDWEGDDTFVLTVGNASSTLVELNGSTIKLPKTESNLVRDFLISKNNLP